jgi:hypothetical protein
MVLRRLALALGLMTLLGAWYVDPGLGSLLWQLVVSGIVGGLFTFRRALTRCVAHVRRLRGFRTLGRE